MPLFPLKVEKLRNQTAKPTGTPSHPANSQKTPGFSPNSAASSIASVATTSCVSFSYSASSRTNCRTRPASPGRAERRTSDISAARSHRHRGLDVRVRLVAFEREVLVPEREQVLYGWIE